MGTKNKPGSYDCYANAHPDEPMFILLGRDPFAAGLVEEWARRREAERGWSAKVDEARACAHAMRAWRSKEVQQAEAVLAMAKEIAKTRRSGDSAGFCRALDALDDLLPATPTGGAST